VSRYLQRMARREERREFTGRLTIARGRHPNVITAAQDVPCKVRPSERASAEVASGGDQVTLGVFDVVVPYGTDLQRGDVLTLTRSYDDMQVGWWCTVVEVLVDEEVTNRVAIGHRSRS